MKLFRATANDVSRIAECARLCCEEHGEKRTGGALNWDWYEQILWGMLRQGLGAMWLYEDDGRIVGGIAGREHTDPLTGRLRAARVFLYVLPEYRGQCSILRLMRLFEGWAREHKCQYVSQSFLPTMPEATKRVYEALGYHEQETVFLKKL
jgi:GNAT superfamily N-acetyltransferase